MIKIIKSREANNLTPAGTVEKTIIVTWYADENHGPYTTSFRFDAFNGDVARAQLEQQAANILAINGPKS